MRAVVMAASPKTATESQAKTAPFDPRFPNQNQTKYCFQSYLDFHRCQKVKGEGYQACLYFQQVFNSICPSTWVEKWNTQREEDAFAGKL